MGLTLPKPYYADEWVTLFCADCRDLLAELPEPALVIADPPYGVGQDGGAGRDRSGVTRSRPTEPIVGDDEPFDPTHLLGYPRLVLFGANHYAHRLPPSPSWLVWDKRDGLTSKRQVGFNDQADVEMAWTNLGGPARLLSHRWMGMLRASERDQLRVMPAQKPVALFMTILAWWSEFDDLILDPYAGSGSVLLAARLLGRRAIGIEIDEGHCRAIVDRLAQGVLPFGSQGDLPAVAPTA